MLRLGHLGNQKSWHRVEFIQSFVKICQLVKAAMKHAHIHAQHTFFSLWEQKHTDKDYPFSFGLPSIWAQKYVISEMRSHAAQC